MSCDDQALEDDLFGSELADNPSADSGSGTNPSASSASSAAASVATKPAATNKSKRGLRFYAVTSVGAKTVGLNCKLVVGGVYCTTWGKLANFLHNRELFCSSISLKGFDTLEEAAAHAQSRTRTATEEIEIFEENWVDKVLDGSRGGFGRNDSRSD